MHIYFQTGKPIASSNAWQGSWPMVGFGKINQEGIMRLLVIGALSLFIMTSGANAASMNQLMPHCQIDLPITEMRSNSTCYNYFVGVIDTLALNEYSIGMMDICMPDGVTYEQATSVIWNHIRTNAKDWHDVASFLAAKALYKDFPCE